MVDSSLSPTSGGYNVKLSESELENVNAETVEMRQCIASSITGREIKMEQSGGIFMTAEKIEAKNSVAGVVIAQEVHGDIRPLFSFPSALLIAGAIIFGVAMLRKK
jgi:hypothetical protein